jgi:phage tail-like protein
VSQEYEFILHINSPTGSQEYVIPMGIIIIGREPGNNLPLIHPLVSRQHARLECKETECHITDLGSANGTFANGEKLTPNVPWLLYPGAVLKIGPFDLVFEQNRLETKPVEAPRTVEIPPKPELTQEPEQKPEPEPQTKAETPPELELTQEPEQKPEPEPQPKVKQTKSKLAPVVPPPPVETPPPPPSEESPSERSDYPPGLGAYSNRLINYLPGIYYTDFMSRFLALFEFILTPIEWNVDNFDMYLDPGSAPLDFLPWLANWHGIVFDPGWSETQRRMLLKEACQIYARRGTRWALSRILEIFTGSKPEIVEFSDPQNPFTFAIKLTLRDNRVNKELVERIVDANKPAHTTYRLEIAKT